MCLTDPIAKSLMIRACDVVGNDREEAKRYLWRLYDHYDLVHNQYHCRAVSLWQEPTEPEELHHTTQTR